MGGSATGSEPLLQRLLSLEAGRSFFGGVCRRNPRPYRGSSMTAATNLSTPANKSARLQPPIVQAAVKNAHVMALMAPIKNRDPDESEPLQYQ